MRICDQHEANALTHFRVRMDGPEKKSEDELRAEARASELKQKSQAPVYGPPKPPQMQ